MQCHFFAGIGGWPLALQLAGWPATRPVWTGSCPCQPFSSAGKQLGTADERHLWPVFANLIRECRPSVVFGEQVASAAGRAWLAGVFADLENMAYRRAGADLCAASVGAPHIRQRLFWVADTKNIGREQRHDFARTEGMPEQPERRGESSRLANTTGGQPRDGELQRSGIDGLRADGGRDLRSPADEKRTQDPAERMGDAFQSRLEGHPGHGDNGHQPGRIDAAATGPAPEAGGAMSGKTGGTSGNTSWSRFDLIPCADGKARRIEPGLAPLAHGIPARVVRLRGYGNAIVPQVAAEFINAYRLD